MHGNACPVYLTCFVKTNEIRAGKNLEELKVYSGHKIDMMMVLLEEKEGGEVVVEVHGKDSPVLLGYLFFLLRIHKQCLVKEQDSGRRKSWKKCL